MVKRFAAPKYRYCLRICGTAETLRAIRISTKTTPDKPQPRGLWAAL